MKKVKRKVSIVILTWNSLCLLKRCLASIESSRALEGYEIVVVDNDSQDGTREFLKSIDSKDSYHIILNSHNRGVGPTRNQGIRIASLVNKINEFVEDDYHEMSRCGLDIISNYLSAETMSKRYQRLYNRILRRED